MKRTKTVLFGLLLALCLSAVPFAFTAQAAPVIEGPYASVPETFGWDDPQGILLTGGDGYKADFAPTMSGVFDLTFRVYSKTSFPELKAADLAAANKMPTENDALEMTALTFTFTDAGTGESFRLVVEGMSDEYVMTPNACVEYGGTRRGLYYALDKGQQGNTAGANAVGRYTYLHGTSFCNTAITGDRTTYNGAFNVNDYTVAASKRSRVVFDPSDMSVYAYRYGYINGVEEKALVWRFDEGSLDGAANAPLYGFDRYTVSVAFQTAAGRTADMLLYSLCGQPLYENAPDTAGPTVQAAVTRDAVVGEKWYLPECFAYDTVEGAIPFNGTVALTCGGQTVDIGSDDTGRYFLPAQAGPYTLSLTPVDGAGNSGPAAAFTVNAYPAAPETVFTGAAEGGTLATGAELRTAVVAATNELYRDPRLPVTVTVTQNGAALPGLEGLDATEPHVFTAAEAGEYVVLYQAEGGSVSTVYRVTDDEVTFTGGDVRPVYGIGTVFAVPEAVAHLSGKSYPTTAVVAFPSGAAYRNATYALTEAGRYTVRYTADIEGTPYTYTRTFEVGYTGSTLFSPVRSSTIEDNSVWALNDGIRGVRVTAEAENAAVRCNNVIDLGKLPKNVPFIELTATPDVRGKAECYQLTVTLTDLHDARNKVDITIYWYVLRATDLYRRYDWSFVKAGATGQPLTGVETTNNNKVHTDYRFGNRVYHSFSGEYRYTDAADGTLKLYFDHQKKQVLTSLDTLGFVIDLDDPQYFSTLWGGFTTGEAVLSVSAQSLTERKAHYTILSAGGVSAYGQPLDDGAAPVVTVDTQGYDDLPHGKTGETYPLFAASAYDRIDGAPAVATRVYYAYGTGRQTQLPVTDGRFTPDRAGEYTVEYTAVNSRGRTGVVTMPLTVEDALPELTLTPSGAVPDRAYIGRELTLPSFTASGGSGTAKVTTVVTQGGTTIEGGDTVTPDRAGTYTVTVKAVDYLGTESTYSFDFAAVADTKPVISGIELPRYFLSGEAMEIGSFRAVDYAAAADGSVEAQKTVTVSVGERTFPVENGRVTVTVDTASQAIVTFTATGREATETVARTVPVVAGEIETDKGTRWRLSEYFVKDGIAFTSNEAGYTLTADSGSMTFAVPLIDDNFDIKFTTAGSVDTVRVELTDARTGQTVFMQADAAVKDGAGYLPTTKVTNGRVTTLATVNKDGEIAFTYAALGQAVTDVDGRPALVLDVDTFGKPFGGFTGLVYVTVKVTGEIGGSLKLVTFGGQTFRRDEIAEKPAPQARLLGYLPISAELNETVVLPSAVGGGLLDAAAQVTVTVRSPGGETVLEASAARENTFTAAGYGSYIVTYTVTTADVSRPQVQTVSVVDREKPTLTLDGTIQEGRVGKTMRLPAARSADNITAEMRVFAFVVSPDNEMVYVGDTMTYTPGSAGTYTVRYYVEDEFANGTTLDVTWKVVEGGNTALAVSLSVCIPVGVLLLGGAAAWWLIRRRKQAAAGVRPAACEPAPEKEENNDEK